MGTFRATLLAQEWQSLADRFAGNLRAATRARLSLCSDWEQIWNVKARNQQAQEEARLNRLSDDELLAEWHRAEVDSPLMDLIAGEMERRNLDD